LIRPSTVIWLCAVVAVGYAMFQVKYEVMQQEETLAKLNKQIAGGREQIRVLDAEWSYLTQPSRLEKLSDKYLGLTGINSSQIRSMAALPERPDAPTALVSNRSFTPAADDFAAQIMAPRIAAVAVTSRADR
jgi:hypothetical protein